MNPDPSKIRSRAGRALRHYFEKKRSPRFVLTLVILVTSLVGLGLSYLLLRAGMTSMAARYPLSLLGAYGIFLLLLRVWVEFEKSHFDPEDPELLASLAEEESPGERHIPTRDSSWLDWLDLPGDFGGGDGCLPALLIAAVVGLVVLAIGVIGGAPILIAEVFVDAVLAGMLYRRLRIPASEHWLGTAVRRTWLHALGAAIVLAIVGACLDHLAPNSDSVGNALKEIF